MDSLMKLKHALFAGLIPLTLTACESKYESPVPAQQINNAWYQEGQQNLAAKDFIKAQPQAKNIILFVGDGMGISTVTAARILEGQRQGKLGEEHVLSFEKFPFTGLSKTYNVDAQTPDSAGTMTAMVTGVKTNAGIISIDENVIRKDCRSGQGNELMTTLELAELAGLSTGIVTTARLTHATPAATYAKSADRNWEDTSDMSEDAIEAGCEDIASQLISFKDRLDKTVPGAQIDGIDVAMGGGRRHFLPKDEIYNTPDAVSKIEGDRTDGRHLINEWKTNNPEGVYLSNKADFDKLKISANRQVLGLFNESHMRYEADRKNDLSGEPTLGEMTEKAIKLLEQNKKGFFLMVESGRIDHGHHAGNAYNALNDTIEMAKAVEIAVKNTNPEETLIIVTADHSHVFTIAGYPKRGNPILGKVINIGKDEPALDLDSMPYTTLGYMNGLGHHDFEDACDANIVYDHDHNAGRHDLTDVNTQASGFHQEALVPLPAETHGGEDVSIYATGPHAPYVTGVNEQNVIFHIMNSAADLENRAAKAIQR